MKSLAKLSETEMEIMQAVWELATPVSVAQLLEVFEQRGWKTSTLSTMMNRLIEKGFLTKSMNGKMNLYTPTLTFTAYKEHETQSFLGRLFNGKVKNFIASLVDDEELSKDDIKELKEWFARKEGKQ